MTKRTTVMIEDELIKKLYEIQANLIRESNSSVSISFVLNESLRKALKK